MQGKGQGTREGKEEKKQGKETLIGAEYDSPGGGRVERKTRQKTFLWP